MVFVFCKFAINFNNEYKREERISEERKRVEADLNISVSAVFNIKVFVSHHLLRIKEK